MFSVIILRRFSDNNVSIRQKLVSNFIQFSLSILPVLSKISERIIHETLHGFFNQEKLFYNKQFRFRSGYSTLYALAELLEETRLDNNSMFTSLLLDLRKTFDTIDHSLFIEKQERYDVRGVCVDWFNSYLNNRKQFLQVQGAGRNILTISCGILQASVIGPLLFIFYINDIPNSCKDIIPYLFADDTNALYKQPKKQSNLDSLLFELVEWMPQNNFPWMQWKQNCCIFLDALLAIFW